MKYAIVYSSLTGNTECLGKEIQNELGEGDCVYMGKPSETAKDADIIYVGFWTDKGSCSQEISEFLSSLHQKQVFLFGTAGFGGDQSYFNQILERVQNHLASDNILLDTYMCQGKMPSTVRQRYEGMLTQNEKMQAMIDNFDKASTHPDQCDIQALIEKVKIVKQVEV